MEEGQGTIVGDESLTYVLSSYECEKIRALSDDVCLPPGRLLEWMFHDGFALATEPRESRDRLRRLALGALRDFIEGHEPVSAVGSLKPYAPEHRIAAARLILDYDLKLRIVSMQNAPAFASRGLDW